jgi:hypothetical protein
MFVKKEKMAGEFFLSHPLKTAKGEAPGKRSKPTF